MVPVWVRQHRCFVAPLEAENEEFVSESDAHRKEKAGRSWVWTRFPEQDSLAIEVSVQERRRKHRNSSGAATNKSDPEELSDVLHVSAGLYDVDLEAMTVEPVYWDGAEHRIVRALWFILDNTGCWMPVEDRTAESLEAAYYP